MAQQGANKNPYAARENIDNDVPAYAMPHSRDFAVPSPNDENGTLDSPIGAYAPSLRVEVGNTPDPMRIQQMRTRDFRPEPASAPEVFFDQLDADKAIRHSVETLDADGWEEFKGGSGKPAARNPRSNPGPEPRPMMRMSPANWSFTRPMWGGPRRLNNMHFSMADHRRDYPILGTQPVRNWRNTYRIQPVPFDLDMVDVPPNDPTDVPSARIQAVEVPLSSPVRRLM
jgi:hypothetical protein